MKAVRKGIKRNCEYRNIRNIELSDIYSFFFFFLENNRIFFQFLFVQFYEIKFRRISKTKKML